MVRVGRRATSRRWRIVGVLGCALALGATASCAGGAGAQWRAPGEVDITATAFTFSHADNQNVSPADLITVSLTGGTLEAVTLTDAGGKAIKGQTDPHKISWVSSERLDYGKQYTVTASAVGDDGTPREESRTFKTVKPKNQVLANLRAFARSSETGITNADLSLLDGHTYGVGQPILVTFDEKIKSKAVAERALIVTSDPPVAGAWRWIDDQTVMWRPKEYWPAGTRVTVTASLYGRDLGGGLYGQNKVDTTAAFTIGPAKIAIADSQTHRMKVYIDGKQVTTINGKDVSLGIPISMGKNGGERSATGGWIDFRTQSGKHVITTKFDPKHMTSASFGITDPKSPNFYDEYIKKSLRISVDGEFVHLADWNIYAHGKYNTSHGCVNVAPTYIHWFYENFGPGDIVDVRNTGRNLPWTEGINSAWVLSWNEWQKGSALS